MNWKSAAVLAAARRRVRYGFNSRELARILRVIMDRRDLILRAWHEHFGDGSSI